MDNSVSGLFEHDCDEQALLFINNSTGCSLTEQIFGKIFTGAWDKAGTQTNINPLKTKPICFI
jgi:site-specific recombinase XerD